jgi:hypothetical protein
MILDSSFEGLFNFSSHLNTAEGKAFAWFSLKQALGTAKQEHQTQPTSSSSEEELHVDSSLKEIQDEIGPCSPLLILVTTS